MKKETEHVFKQKFKISSVERNSMFGHSSFVVWFTGLSGSGKSTLANELEIELFQKDVKTFVLDGDNIRLGINSDLGFTAADRKENLRRIGHVAKLMQEAGLVVIASFISPFEEERKSVKEIVGKDNFIEIYVNTPLEICEERDAKGLYEKARNGEIKNFTGIDSPFEPCVHPDILIDTSKETTADSIQRIMQVIQDKLKL
jgi:adenylylsulfate kinase